MDSSTLRSPIKSLEVSKPICVAPDSIVSKVLKTMRDNKIGCVCVVENCKTVGIFTERDVLVRVIGENKNPEAIVVKEVMTADPEYLFEDDEIAFALNRMRVGGFRHVPLADADCRPAGIISVKDIVKHLMKDLQ
ncbi:MAG: cyclic nucleotide-binding/CBS domain-containing protein [bacterium]